MPIPVYEYTLAGHKIRYAFRLAQTKYYFRPLMHRTQATEWDILVSAKELGTNRKLYPSEYPDPYVEFRTLRLPTSGFLMDYDCCLFHATAFRYQGGAWLLTAPSGTGKTTQYLNWQRLHPGEIEMIGGDMPVLELREDDIWVHPSPWNGKERIGGTVSAPLAGIVFLQQGSENRLVEIEPREKVGAAFYQLVGRPQTEKQAQAVAAILDKALGSYQTCRFVNLGDDASTELLREMIRKGEG